MITLAEAKAIYRTGKGHFFDRETFKYWGSRIESALYKNRCFLMLFLTLRHSKKK